MVDLFQPAPSVDAAEYLGPAEAAKVAGTRLTSPPSAWDDEILQLIVRDCPYIPHDRLRVDFSKLDPEAGAATGFAVITGAEHVTLPFIVRNWEVSPPDVMVVGNKNLTDESEDQEGTGDMTTDRVMPLTQENFERALDAGALGEPVPHNVELGTGYTEDGSQMRLPFRGRTVLAHVLGASAEKKAAFSELLEKTPTLVVGFVNNGTGAAVDAWLGAPEPAKTAAAKLASAEIKPATLALLTDLPQEMKTAELSAASVVRTSENMADAVFFDGFDLINPNAAPTRFMAFDDGTVTKAAEVVVGQEVADPGACMRAFAEKRATLTVRPQQMVSIVIEDAGATVITAPLKVASLKAVDQTVTLELSNGIQSQTVLVDPRVKTAFYEESTQSWVLPAAVRVLSFVGYTDDGALEPSKVAEALERKLPNALAHADGQWTLTVAGDQVAKQASTEKIASVLSAYFTPEDAGHLLSTAQEHGVVRFSSDLAAVRADVEAKIAAYQALPAKAAAAMAELLEGTGLGSLAAAAKLAASIGDPQGVDAVLGAGFLTEDNLAEFVSLAPEFEATVEKLARLLMAIRMGFPGDEVATTVAMKSLQRIAERLHSAGQEIGAGEVA